ncbi:MAG TPA: SurA N-terminal domain-containing protein [Thermomonas sp.]|uniref:SurA N-terminal domain-containing protein n=1 Tax=Thermomonas sp. TaxID=1971895 RepID=UPI002C8D4F8C|nr:SurA N-terminal domain-containing protein [Thermomonas sp.]HOV95491.1 SurA N-terminal domain-containing protein [Thermomonas sp.]
MLQKLREKTSGWIATAILGLLIVPFAFFGMESYMSQRVDTYVARIAQPPSWWASAPQVWPITYLWKIDDIDAEAYKDRLETARMRMRAQQGENYDAKAFESVDNKRKILDTLIDDRLMQLAVKRDNIVISDAQVADAIGKIPDFQVDGAFNKDRYQMLLSTQNPPMTPRSFEAKVREGLMDELIPARIAKSAFVTDSELDRLMRLLGERRDVSYVTLPAPAADTAEVTAAQIDAWYKGHQAQFRAPETVRLEYVEVDGSKLPAPVVDEAALRKKYQEQLAKAATGDKREVSHILVAVAADASDAVKKAAEAKAKQLAEMARAPGADFATLAKTNSDDTGSKDKGGDLGWLSKGGMPGTFDDAAFAMQAGEVRGPIKSDFGWHVIKVNQIQQGTQRSFEDMRAELEKEVQQGGREQAFNDLTGKLVDAVYKNPTSLEPAAKAMGLVVQTTPAFTHAGGPGIAADPKVLRAAFSDTLMQDGTASDPIEIGPEHTVLIRVIAHEPERVMPLAQVRDAVVAAIHADRQRKAADTAADALLKAAQAKGLAVAAQAAGLSVSDANDLLRRSPLPSAEAVQAFFDLPRPRGGSVSAGKAMIGGTYMVFALRAVRDGDLAQVTPQERTQLRQQVSQGTGMQAQEAFVRAARAHYDIKVAEDRL